MALASCGDEIGPPVREGSPQAASLVHRRPESYDLHIDLAPTCEGVVGTADYGGHHRGGIQAARIIPTALPGLWGRDRRGVKFFFLDPSGFRSEICEAAHVAAVEPPWYESHWLGRGP